MSGPPEPDPSHRRSSDGQRDRRGVRSRRYWLLAVAAALVLSPPAATAAALIAGAIVAELAIRALAARGTRANGDRSQAAHDAVVLGCEANGERVLLSDRQLSAHALILGASGAGKSTTLLRILTDHVRRGLPVVAIDLKGSPAFARSLMDATAASGRTLRLWTPDGPSDWNPLAHGNATELKDKLISTERFTEPHYQRAAERYVQTVLQVLLESRQETAPTLEQVVGLMDPVRMAAKLRHVQRPLARRVQDYLAGLTPDQVSAIRGLGTRLAILSESHTGTYLGHGSSPAVDLRTALDGDEVALFSLNSSTYGKLAAQVGTLVVQDLVAAVGYRLEHPGPRALIAIDEFSALGSDNVVALLARGREAGVSVLLATQELADLDRAARGLRDQVLGNTAVKIAHRQDVPSSAQTISQMIGTEATWEHTYQTSGGGWLPRHDTGRGTRRQAEQFIVHPNEIKTLPTGHAVLITKLPASRARTVRIAPPQPDRSQAAHRSHDGSRARGKQGLEGPAR